MLSGIVVGYDPGGNGAHGFAELRVENGEARALSTRTLETAEEVISIIEQMPFLTALGVDTLTCWGTGVSGWRPADHWLRNRYKPIQNSVVTPNFLSGSMGLNGMGVLIAARRRFGDVLVTETHPKVLYWKLSGRKYEHQTSGATMDRVLTDALGITVASETEHEWDAAASALTAFEGLTGRWSHDLHALPIKAGERLITPCGTTHYFWPE